MTKKEVLLMTVRNTGYVPAQCERTLTVGQLIRFLEDFDEDMEIYTSHDNGYTFGEITYRDLYIGPYDDNEDEDEDDE